MYDKVFVRFKRLMIVIVFVTINKHIVLYITLTEQLIIISYSIYRCHIVDDNREKVNFAVSQCFH